MIPAFPTFKKIELADEKEIRSLVESVELPPYADFCFVNMWIWNTSGDMLVSKLHGNIVIMFRDYASREAFLSFIGKNKIAETVKTLIEYSKQHYKVAELRLVPEEIAMELAQQGFAVEPDESSHDYVYEVANLAKMHQWKDEKSKNIRAFLAEYPNYEVRHFVLEDAPPKDLTELFERWGRNKNLDSIIDFNEYQAFKRLLQLKNKNIHVVLFYIKDVLAGFTVYELVGNYQYAISRFAKADTGYGPGIYDILNWEEAKILQAAGVTFYNWEQDLGIPGLRRSKMKYNPAFSLKKFIVSMKTEPFGYLLTLDLYGCKKGVCDDIGYCYHFLEAIVDKLGMTKQSPPFIFQSDGVAYPDKAGLSGWVPLIESGIQIHTLAPKNFISIDVYSCNKFEAAGVQDFVQKYFDAKEVEVNFIERGVKYNEIH